MRLDCKRGTAIEDKTCCARHLMGSQPDFLEQKSALEEVVSERGHIFEMFPKFHCECNYIERYWGAVKRIAREQCDYTFSGLRQNLPRFLNSIPLSTIRKYERKSWRYIDAYHQGLLGLDAEKAVKKYKSHRRVGLPSEIMALMRARHGAVGVPNDV